MKTMIFLCAMLGVAFCAPTIYQMAAPMDPPSAPPRSQFMTAPAVKKIYVKVPVAIQQTYAQAPAYMAAAPARVAPSAPVVTGTLHLTQDTLGHYKYGYTSSDGQSKTEAKTGDDVTGSFSFISPEGKRFNLNYVANKEGFRPEAEHLPEAPEMPEMPQELAAAYKEAHERLEKAFEEARLRGDDEHTSDDGSYKPELYEAPYEEEEDKMATTMAPVSYQTYVAAKVPVQATHAAAYQIYTIPAPIKSIYAPAPAPTTTIAPAAPAPYSSMSFSTELGGHPPIPEPAPMAVIKSGYTY